jgi:hypothetical protein
MTVVCGLRPVVRGLGMDRVKLIVTALAAGTAREHQEAASPAEKKAYHSLRTLVHKRLAGQGHDTQILARYEKSPDTLKRQLTEELTASKAGDDAELVGAALTLMSLADRAGFRARKYTPIPERIAELVNRAKMIAGLVAEPFGGLTAGSVTIYAAIAITVLSAGRLAAVSNGNITTAKAILYSSGVGGLALSVLLLLIPIVASVVLFALVVTVAWLIAFTRHRRVAIWTIASCAAVVGVLGLRVIPVYMYVFSLLSSLGILILGALVIGLSFLMRSGGKPRTRAEAVAEGDNINLIINGRWRPDSLLYMRIGLIAALLIGFLYSLFNASMWLPAQRVQLHDMRPFTAYVLKRDSQGVELLRDGTRLIETVSNSSIVSISLCSFSSTVGFSFLPSRINRVLNVTPPSVEQTFEKGSGYPSCPR